MALYSNTTKLVPSAVSSLSADNQHETGTCLSFLITFTASDESRKIVLCETEGVIQSILVALDTKFDQAQKNTKRLLLNLITNILSGSGHTLKPRTEIFLRNDGFRILHNVLRSTVHWAQATVALWPLKPEESKVLRSSVIAICSLYGAITNQLRYDNSGLHQSLFTLDSVGLASHLALMYRLFSWPTCGTGTAFEAAYKETAIKATVNFWSYVHLFHPDEAVEMALLYHEEVRHDPEASNVPFIVLFLRANNHPLFAHLAGLAQLTTTMYSYLPTVKAVIDREMSTHVPSLSPALSLDPPVVLKLCACPGCLLGGNNKVKLLKCGRCKRVEYCGKEHQLQHWSEHKKVCGK